MWHLVSACDKYDLNIINLKTWFAGWYSVQAIDGRKSRELLHPCWWFDHIIGFALVTKSLAYTATSYIKEENPKIVARYHLPSRIIRKSNKNPTYKISYLSIRNDRTNQRC